MAQSQGGVRHYEGFLHKKSPKSIMGMHRWQLRFWVLYEDRLEYFKNKDDKQPIGSIPINFILNVVEHLKRGGARFDITIDGESERVFSLLAETQKLCQKWVKELNSVLAIAARKPVLGAKALVEGKTPWKNKDILRASKSRLDQKSHGPENDAPLLNRRARDHGYVCGKQLKSFAHGYGFVCKASRVKQRFNGLVHIVPKGGADYKKIHEYFTSQVEVDRPMFMKVEIAGATADSQFIVYDHGIGSLFAHLKARGRLNEGKVRTIGAEVSLALRVIHAEGLTFSMLRPENIFLTPKGHVRLVDCWHNSGLSCEAHVLEDIVSEYVTPDYLENKTEDALSDWWRLGILLYELTCGIPPFHSLTHDRNEVLEKIRKHQDLLPTLQFPKDSTAAARGFIKSLLGTRETRERFTEWNNIEKDPFFASVDFEALWRREEAEAEIRRNKRKKHYVPTFNLRVMLQAVRDLRFGKLSDNKSVTLGVKSDRESHAHITAPVLYSSTSLEFNQRNIFIMEKLTEDVSFQLFVHCHDDQTKSKSSAHTNIKLKEISQGGEMKVGFVYEKWVDLFSSDSSTIADVKLTVEIEKVNKAPNHISSTLSYQEFFEIDGFKGGAGGGGANGLHPKTALKGAEGFRSTAEKIRRMRSTMMNLKGSAMGGGNTREAAMMTKKNNRFQKEGFNLDLTYVTPRLIAMSSPLNKPLGSHSNTVTEVQRFLRYFHVDHHKLYCLSPESVMMNKPLSKLCSDAFAFDEIDVPEFQMILDFCIDVDKYLEKDDEKNVVCVHCSDGKERSGLLIACYMLYSEIQPSAQYALDQFALKRTQDAIAVISPSRRRYAHYFQRYLREYHFCNPPRIMDFSGKPLVLHHIRISLVNKERLSFQVRDVKKRALYEFESKKPPFNLEAKSQYAEYTCHFPLAGDRKVIFFSGKKFETPVCWVWVNTNFIDDNFLGFERSEVDGIRPEDKIFPSNFKIELFFCGDEKNSL